jgi:hypothetical protein
MQGAETAARSHIVATAKLIGTIPAKHARGRGDGHNLIVHCTNR